LPRDEILLEEVPAEQELVGTASGLREVDEPLAEADLFGLYRYIAERSGPAAAGAYIDRIEAAFGWFEQQVASGAIRWYGVAT